MSEAAISDSRLTTIAAVLSVLGLIILFFYAKQLEPKQIAIGDVSGQPENSYVEVVGSIRSISSKSGSLSINLCEFSDCTLVFMPSSISDNLELNPYLLKRGDRLLVRGTVHEYLGEKEIIPSGAGGLELA